MKNLNTEHELYYRYYPAKKQKKGTIFFIHGYAVNSEYHYNFINRLKDYDYYAVELPGHGITPLTSKLDLYPHKFARQVAKLIRELNLNDIYLMGHSMGGGIAMMVEQLIPHRIKKVIAVTPMNTHGTKTIKEVNGFLHKFQPKSHEEIGTFYDILMCDYEKNKNLITQEEIDNVIKMHNDYKGNFNILKMHMCSPINMAHLAKAERNLPRPTLLITGAHDGCINAKTTTKNLIRKNKKYGNLQVVCFEDAGHIPFLEIPDKYFKTIIDFIEAKEKKVW